MIMPTDKAATLETIFHLAKMTQTILRNDLTAIALAPVIDSEDMIYGIETKVAWKQLT